jgi:hypothetical protein
MLGMFDFAPMFGMKQRIRAQRDTDLAEKAVLMIMVAGIRMH